MQLSALAAAISISTVAMAQGAPGNVGSSVDLSRYYFPSSQQEISDRSEINAALDRLGRLKGRINSSSQLLALLQANDAAQILFARHDDYLYLRCAINRKDNACDEEGKLDSEFQAKTAFFGPAILSIPEDHLREFFSRQPELRAYSFELSDIRRKASHLLPEAQERILDEFNPEISGWQYGLYQQIIGAIQFGPIQTPAGPLDVIRRRNLIAGTPTHGYAKRDSESDTLDSPVSAICWPLLFCIRLRRNRLWLRRTILPTLRPASIRAYISILRAPATF